MEKLILSCATITVAVLLVFAAAGRPAEARTKYKNAFYEKYAEGEYKAVANDSVSGRCWLCHVNMKKYNPPEDGLKKRVRNNYGKAISKFIKKNEKDQAKIIDALEKAAEVQSNPADAKSPTFGELIESGKLPGDGVADEEDLKRARQLRDAE